MITCYAAIYFYNITYWFFVNLSYPDFVSNIFHLVFNYSSIFILLIQICGNKDKYSTLLHLLQSDAPHSAIIFVGEQVSVSYPCQVYS